MRNNVVFVEGEDRAYHAWQVKLEPPDEAAEPAEGVQGRSAAEIVEPAEETRGTSADESQEDDVSRSEGRRNHPAAH